MAGVPSYRTIAERTLGQAADELNAMPQGQVASVEIQARASKAQATATVAVAQALLDIGDVLREHDAGEHAIDRVMDLYEKPIQISGTPHGADYLVGYRAAIQAAKQAVLKPRHHPAAPGPAPAPHPQ